MSDDPNDASKQDPARKTPSNQEHGDLEAFSKRLEERRRQNAPESKLARRLKSPPGSALGLAFRVAVELVSAVAVGLGIGWLLDVWLDTRPWMMIVFIVLGGAAGVLNVYRMASGYGYAAGYDKPESSGPSDDPDRPQG